MKNGVYTSVVFCLAMLARVASAQSASMLQFSFANGASPLQVQEDASPLRDSAQVQITNLRFYVSAIQFLRNKEVVLTEKNSFHLIDASKPASCMLLIDNKKKIFFDEIMFHIGIDSATNVSGAMGGDLDPTKGMYWAWQSGYINVKIEGTSSVCNTRNHEFQFHLGGYLPPHYALQTLHFPVKNPQQIQIDIDIQKFLKNIDLARQNHIMSPSKEAVVLSKIFADACTILEK